ncbi:peptidoglycan-N-acetylglucosamine deacetylase [Folsomia candida]|nr:peptidoglycan-N-acetylglucosamine deacetylase [Folsomia candida]
MVNKMGLIFTLVGVISLALATLGSPYPKAKQEDGVHTKCTQPGMFSLTFDDGPLPGRTEAVLDVLKEANVTATFFVCGQTYSDLHSVEGQATVRRIIAEGHQIGIHTWSHPYLADPWRSVEEVTNEVKSVADKLLEITGNRIPIMRPPYGAYNDSVLDIVRGELGLEVIMWNVNTLDWSHPGDTAAAIENYKIETSGSHPSVDSFIALHHDPLPGSSELAVEAIRFMISAGYRFVTVGECIGL